MSTVQALILFTLWTMMKEKKKNDLKLENYTKHALIYEFNRIQYYLWYIYREREKSTHIYQVLDLTWLQESLT